MCKKSTEIVVNQGLLGNLTWLVGTLGPSVAVFIPPQRNQVYTSSAVHSHHKAQPEAVLRQLRCEVHPPLSLVSASDQIEQCISGGWGSWDILPYVYTVYCPYGLWRPSVGGGVPGPKCDQRSWDKIFV